MYEVTRFSMVYVGGSSFTICMHKADLVGNLLLHLLPSWSMAGHSYLQCTILSSTTWSVSATSGRVQGGRNAHTPEVGPKECDIYLNELLTNLIIDPIAAYRLQQLIPIITDRKFLHVMDSCFQPWVRLIINFSLSIERGFLTFARSKYG